ncbi:MAG: tetratricopeptide repeat protein [Desulfohalobiaceae bacterium]|nr:tetratricopeptide repeat protein [Desulfohalobiaceae bacterium]MCF8085374.1 tetratricopeptide repeat protein [Desulfohalobiaceae bacterium]
MPATTGKGAKLVLVITALSLLAVLGYSLLYRVQHPLLTKQQEQTRRQASQQPPQEAMDRVAELMGRIQENPKDVQALTEVARMFMSMQSFERAAKFWERVVDITPDKPGPRQRLAMCYYRLNRHQDAASQLRRVLELDPDNAYAHYNLGLLLTAHLEEPEKGREHFRRVLSAEGADSELKDRARRELSQSPSNEE